MRKEKGFSLIEILVVLVIVASIVGMGVSSLGNYSTTRKMKSEAIKLLSRIKYVYEQAASKSEYNRITFDLDAQTYFVESSSTAFSVAREGDKQEELRKKNEERNSDENSFDQQDENPAPTGPSFAESEDDLLEIFKLPEDVRLTDVYIMHQKEKLTEGKAYLYFFPRGQTEFAVLHLVDVADEENAITLIVNPLTGSVEFREGS